MGRTNPTYRDALRAIEDRWHIRQGKGDKSKNSQDLLSHSMDVVQITHNIQSALRLENRFNSKDYLTAAFFHDLHKLDKIGGTESMKKEEVKSFLEDWGIKEDVLETFSLEEFRDVLQSIHQFHGGYESGARVRMNSNDELRLLTNVVRIADGIASEEDLTSLYSSGYRDNTEALDEINSNQNSDLNSNYILGYHQLSEIKPALGAAIHESVREVVRDEGGHPIASRKDATIYLLPQNFNKKSNQEFTERVVNKAQHLLNDENIKSNVPDKIRTDLYGVAIDVETIISNQRAKLSQEGGDNDLTTSYRRIAESVTSELEKDDAQNYEVVTEGEQLVLVDINNDQIKTIVPTTQQGYIIGDTASNLIPVLNSEVEQSRIELLQTLFNVDLNLDRYEDANWRTKESYLARIIGNYYFQNTEESADEILSNLEETSKDLLDPSEDEEKILDKLSEYISEILYYSSYDEEESILTKSSISQEIQVNQNYKESCILCGRVGELKYKTSQHLPYSKSYMARGKTGEATSDDWDPLLCPICFIDQAIMRAFVNRSGVYIDNMQDTLFFKVFPNRYLGTQQVRKLKNSMNQDFESLEDDAKNYLEEIGEIDEESDVWTVDPYDYEVPLTDSADTIDIGGMPALVSSENYFLIAAEYHVTSDDNPAKQTTLTWLDAIQRGLLFYRFYNLNVEIESNPEINVEQPYPKTAGLSIRSPPSHISTIFGEEIDFTEVEECLDGMANMSYALKLPQYNSEDNLNQIYSEFRASLYPGSRIFRQAERNWDNNKYGPIWLSHDYEDIFSVCAAIDNWKDRTMSEQTTNRIREVVEAFQISVKGNPSTHKIQEPVRTLINKILNSKNETKEEIINEAAASIYRRVERKWDNPDIYFGYESDEPIQKVVEEGCETFYEKVYEDMLDGDKIRLADQKEDILDAFYFNVQKQKRC